MDLLMLLLIIVAVASVGSWGYGTYGRPVAASGPVVGGPGWVNPMGIVGLVVVLALVMMFVTGWRPFAMAPMW